MKKMKNKLLSFLQRPHVCLFLIILLLLVSGGLSLAFYCQRPAWSAILASISAGCVTGIIFYILTNARSKELLEEREECESIKEHYELARETITLCTECEENPDACIELIPQIMQNANRLLTFMGVLFVAAPKTTALINDYPANYKSKTETAVNALGVLSSYTYTDNSISKDAAISALTPIIAFCAQTLDILFEPMVQLMQSSDRLNRSII